MPSQLEPTAAEPKSRSDCFSQYQRHGDHILISLLGLPQTQECGLPQTLQCGWDASLPS